MQCWVISLSPITMFVPGVQTLPVGRLPLPLPPRNWTSIETGNSWSFLMVSGVWPWIITPLLRKRPARPARALLADEPILDAQLVVGEWRLVEEVPELAVELGILVVGDLQDAVFDAERVAEVLAGVVALDLGFPAVEVLAVEERDPAVLGRRILPALDASAKLAR